MKKRRNELSVPILILAFALALSGCGGAADKGEAPKQAQAAENSSNAKDATAAAQGSDNAEPEMTDGWPRTIVDAAGIETVLEAKPERIAVLHPLYLDYFFALGQPPVASASAGEALAEFVTLQPYAAGADILDLGSGRDLNLETIMEADPDVIVTFQGHIDAIYDDLVRIAPVIQIGYSDDWQDATRLCARIIGHEEQAEQYIEETKQLIAQTRSQLAPLEDLTYALVRVDGKANFVAQGKNNTVYYNEESGFGLHAPESYPEDSANLSLESLAAMDPDVLIIQHDLDTARAAVEALEPMAVWQSLKAVQNDRVLLLDNSLNSSSILAVRSAAEHFSKLAD
ncbi:ferrichrome ABC transporter [Paenibacillus sp. 598K]|uniref:iron-siderophore ABC transporter substrate-binding protein n=1 Tax=Paenibacillus sp. 598K TaxID=1117987 RepID=UPI000FFAC98A|nr:iron-siderophore ABC transporter substrate-binding protein [Paenibacillus sp. 598K]GBF75818.1 ferrichrome ABC transporter [Paenibacillus sp. 598K]